MKRITVTGCHPECCVKVGRKQASRDAREVQPVYMICQGREMPADFQKACAEKAEKSGKEILRMAGAPQEREPKPLPPEPPSLAGCWLTARSQSSAVSQRDSMQADVLDRRPDNRQ